MDPFDPRTQSIRLPFALRHRIGLAVLIAVLTYITWGLVAAASAAVGLAALFGDRASKQVLESPLDRFIGGWQILVGASAIAFIIMVVGKTRFTVAGATVWFLGLSVLSIMGSVLYGFTWWIVLALCLALLAGLYAGVGARAV